MQNDIISSYSLLNCYKYENKFFLMSALDWLSAPSRYILGGRNVFVLSQTYDYPMSTAKKIATLFFSILIFPVAMVSIAALILKLASFSFIWEKKIVKIQTEKTWGVINQFNEAAQNNKLDDVIDHYKKRPEIGARNDVYVSLFRTINKKINLDAPWSEVQGLIRYLNNSEGIGLIDLAVLNALTNAHKNNFYWPSGTNIMNFVKQSLKDSSLEQVDSCVKHLLKSSLQFDVNDARMLSALKLDITNELIHSLIEMKKKRMNNSIARQGVKLSIIVYQTMMFKDDQLVDAFHYSHMLRYKKSTMTEASKMFSCIRKLHWLKHDSWRSLKLISKNFKKEPEKYLNEFNKAFRKYLEEIQKITSGSEKALEEYVEVSKEYFSAIFKQYDQIQTVIDIAQLNKVNHDFIHNHKQINERIENIIKIFNVQKNHVEFEKNYLEYINIYRRSIVLNTFVDLHEIFKDLHDHINDKCLQKGLATIAKLIN